MGVIADMIRSGIDADLVERVALEMVETARHGLPVRTSRQDRNARYYERRKERLKASETSESVLTKTNQDVLVSSSPPPKITNQTPSTPSSNTKPGAKRRTSLAEDAQPTKANGAAAMEAGLSPDEFRSEWRAFRDMHRSKGNTMSDWDAAWRTWLRNRQRFSPTPRAPPTNRRPTIHDRLARFSDEQDQDQTHVEPPHDGPTIDGDASSGPKDAGGRYEACGAVEPSGTGSGRALASAGYAARIG